MKLIYPKLSGSKSKNDVKLDKKPAVLKNLGKKKSKETKKIKKGKGSVGKNIEKALDRLLLNQDPKNLAEKTFVPIVLIYGEKEKKKDKDKGKNKSHKNVMSWSYGGA